MDGDLISRSALHGTFRAYMIERFDRERCSSEENCKNCDRPCLWIRQVSEAPAVDALPIDEMFCEMMNWAVRYALGRRTYAASDTASYVLHLVPKLDDKTLTIIEQDIRERGDNLGDECDAFWWRKLLDAVVAEMIRRKDNG